MIPMRRFAAMTMLVAITLLTIVVCAAPITPAPPTEAQIRAWIEALDSTDLEARRQAADNLIAAGEVALPYIEDAFASGRHKAMGQPKIVLMALRSMREDRLWNERLVALASKGMRDSFLVKRNGRSGGRADLVISKGEGADDELSVKIESGLAGKPPEETITARVKRDRTFTPVSVRIADQRAAGESAVEFADRKATGVLRGERVDRPVPTPVTLDWVMGVVATQMPLEPDALVVTTVYSLRDGSCSGTANLRCAGRQDVKVGRVTTEAWVFELTGEGFDSRRYVVSDDRRLLLADVDGVVTLETLETPEPKPSGRREGTRVRPRAKPY